MFGVKHNECVGFESRWKVKKVYSQADAQTTEYTNKDVSTTTVETSDKEVQCDNTRPATPRYDVDKLAEWMKAMYPKVKRELDDAVACKAFQGYRLMCDTTDVNCRVLQNVEVLKDDGAGEQILRVSAISWNCNGKILAVALYDKHYNSWCIHTGCIYIYSLDKDGLSPKPQKKYHLESCVTVLDFHPKQENILASGTYAGVLTIFNIHHDEGDAVVTQVNAHEDGVTQVSWVNDIDGDKLLLASSSLDGYLVLWNVNLTESSIAIKQKTNFCIEDNLVATFSNHEQKYKIKSQLFGSGKSNDTSAVADKVVRGVICFDFSKHIPDMFVVGAEGGLVVQCSMLGANKLKGSTNEVPILDPVFMYHEPHKGEINSIKMSPNHKEMFMSSASDAEIRIYLVGQEEPARVIFLSTPVLFVTWVSYEEKLVAGCGASGIIEIFDITTGDPIESILKEKTSLGTLTQMDINRSHSTLVATGNDRGTVSLWRIPWNSISYLISK